MNRFDKTFHNVDPETSRPFSAGQPDGVWIASMLYFVPIAAGLVGFVSSVFQALKSSDPNWQAVANAALGFVLVTVLLLPAVLLLFNRSKVALFYGLFLLALFLVLCIFSYLSQPDTLFIPAFALLLQLIGMGYFWGLKEDNLLR